MEQDLKEQIQELKDKEVTMRKEFAKFFNLYEQGNSFTYSRGRDLRLPSWSEIFFELGKLFAVRDSHTAICSFDGRITMLESKLLRDETPSNQIHVECTDPDCIFPKS